VSYPLFVSPCFLPRASSDGPPALWLVWHDTLPLSPALGDSLVVASFFCFSSFFLVCGHWQQTFFCPLHRPFPSREETSALLPRIRPYLDFFLPLNSPILSKHIVLSLPPLLMLQFTPDSPPPAPPSSPSVLLPDFDLADFRSAPFIFSVSNVLHIGIELIGDHFSILALSSFVGTQARAPHLPVFFYIAPPREEWFLTPFFLC